MPRYKKCDFYSWYKELQDNEQRIKNEIDDIDGLKNISWDFKSGNRNSKHSSVEKAIEEREVLLNKHYDITMIILTVIRAMRNIICDNMLGYTVIKGKMDGKQLKEIKGIHSKKACEAAERKGIEDIKRFLEEENIRCNF